MRLCVDFVAGQDDALYGLPNCQELVPGVLNVHWNLSDSVLDIALEGTIRDIGNQYLAFGFSQLGVPSARMTGSTALIGGFVGEQPFALNYVLGSKSTCDYATGNGVCPDFAGNSTAPKTTSAKVIQANRNLIFFLRKSKLSEKPGLLTGTFLVGYAVARGFVEMFRQPDAHLGYLMGGMTMGQLLSVPMIIIGLYLIFKPKVAPV